jgi:hypothetical protein
MWIIMRAVCIDTFLIESCPTVVQALYFLLLQLTLSAHQTRFDLYVDLTFHFRYFFYHRGKCFQTLK